MISTVQFLTSTWEIIFIGRYIYYWEFGTTSSYDPLYSEHVFSRRHPRETCRTDRTRTRSGAPRANPGKAGR